MVSWVWFGLVFNRSVTSDNEDFFKEQWELQHFESCIYVKSEKDTMPFYAFLMHMENANQMLDSSHIIDISATVGRRMTRDSVKRTACLQCSQRSRVN